MAELVRPDEAGHEERVAAPRVATPARTDIAAPHTKARESSAPSLGLALALVLFSVPRPAHAEGHIIGKHALTSPAEAYIRSLQQLLTEAARRVAELPEEPAARLALSEALYQLAPFTGRRDDLARALEQATECIRLSPTNAACFLLRARQHQALLMPKQARRDALQSLALGGPPEKAEALMSELDWADGKYLEASQSIRQAAADHPTMENLARRARLEHELGHYPLADHLYAMAEVALVGDEPVRRAWLDAQRGACNLELGRLALAESFLRFALERLPSYPFALSQLAQVMVARRDLRAATRIYRKLVLLTFEPEYLGALAGVHRLRGHHTQADTLRVESARLFEEGLQRFPSALRVPAVIFYLGEGRDVQRAVSLLEEDTANESGDIMELRARAYLAARNLAKAETAIRTALTRTPFSLQTLRTAEATYRMLVATAH